MGSRVQFVAWIAVLVEIVLCIGLTAALGPWLVMLLMGMVWLGMSAVLLSPWSDL